MNGLGGHVVKDIDLSGRGNVVAILNTNGDPLPSLSLSLAFSPPLEHDWNRMLDGSAFHWMGGRAQQPEGRNWY